MCVCVCVCGFMQSNFHVFSALFDYLFLWSCLYIFCKGNHRCHGTPGDGKERTASLDSVVVYDQKVTRGRMYFLSLFCSIFAFFCVLLLALIVCLFIATYFAGFLFQNLCLIQEWKDPGILRWERISLKEEKNEMFWYLY